MNFYVIDHHPLMAQGLSRVLRNIRPYCQVVTMERVSQLHGAVVQHGEPHLIVFDLLVPGVKAEATITSLRAEYPEAAIVIFSELQTASLEAVCLNAGADAFMGKSMRLLNLHRRFQQVLAQKFPNEATQMRAKPLRMTSRQVQLLHTIEYGMSNADIAQSLSLSPHTVKVHLWRLFHRFDVRNRLQLVRYAHDNGLF